MCIYTNIYIYIYIYTSIHSLALEVEANQVDGLPQLIERRQPPPNGRRGLEFAETPDLQLAIATPERIPLRLRAPSSCWR